MGFIRLALSLILISTTAANAQGIGSLDVITQTNGDIHNGTLAAESLTIVAPYGEVTIPNSRMKTLQIKEYDGETTMVLRTRDGELFSGQLKSGNFTVLRPAEPPVAVSAEDIAEVEFGNRPTRSKRLPSPHAFEMTNGDIFRGHLKTSDLMIKNDVGLKTIKRDDLFLMDVVLREDALLPSLRTTLKTSGKMELGSLLNGSLTVMTSFGATLTLKAGAFQTLALGGNDLDFSYRQTAASKRRFRDPLQNGDLGPELVMLKGGKFDHGDLTGRGDGDEKPVRSISLAYPFAIGIYEVTFEEYDKFCEATEKAKPDDSGWGRGRRPVINVTWNDAVAYTKWLSEQTGKTYRLPSDTEWEYVARAETKSRFWWGRKVGKDKANCAGCGSLWDAEKTARVGKFAPNPFGLHDTAGNVFEWAADCYHDSFAEAPRDGKPLEKAAGCGKRVIRGGAWSFPPKEVRSANRWRDFPSRSSDDTGFRVLRELP